MYLELRHALVDLDRLRVYRAGEPPDTLSATEVRLLRYLAERPRVVVPVDELLRDVWEYSPRVVSRTVTTTLARLRAKVELVPKEPDHLLTITGEGVELRIERPPRPDPGPLVGREGALEELAVGRCVTVTGPVGVGRSRLVEERFLADWAEGRASVWVDATGLATGAALAHAVARALGLADDTTLGAALRARGPLVLVLDGLTGLEPAAASLLGAWLAAAPELVLRITADGPLGLPEEQVLPLGPLPPEAAGRLLRRLAVRVRPELADADDGAFVGLARALDGLPLALELAAHWLDVMGLEALTQRVEAGLADRGPLQAAVRHSWQLLSDELRAQATPLAVFAGPFDAEAALEVAGGAGVHPGTLAALRARGWLVGPPSGMRLLGAIRRLLVEEVPTEVHQAHLAWASAGTRADRLAAVTWGVQHDLAGAVAVARALDEQLRLDGAIGLRVETLERFVPVVDQLSEADRWWWTGVLAAAYGAQGRLDEVLALVVEDPPSDEPLAWAAALERAVALSERGDDGVTAAFERARSLARAHGPAAAARTDGQWSRRLRITGDPVGAQAAAVAALAQAERSGVREVVAASWLTMGNTHLQQDRFPEALAAFDQARAHDPAAHVRVEATLYRGRTLVRLERLDEGAEAYREALAQLRAQGWENLMLSALFFLSEVSWRAAAHEEALATLEEATVLARRLGQRRAEAALAHARGLVHLDRGDVAMARAQVQHAVDEWSAMGERRHVAICAESLGRTEHAAGEREAALAAYDLCLAHAEGGHVPTTAAVWRAGLLGSVDELPSDLEVADPDEAQGVAVWLAHLRGHEAPEATGGPSDRLARRILGI